MSVVETIRAFFETITPDQLDAAILGLIQENPDFVYSTSGLDNCSYFYPSTPDDKYVNDSHISPPPFRNEGCLLGRAMVKLGFVPDLDCLRWTGNVLIDSLLPKSWGTDALKRFAGIQYVQDNGRPWRECLAFFNDPLDKTF